MKIDITKHLTTEDGLSHFGVTSLIEDHNGLVWVGTFKGLNIYDGYEFKTFNTENSNGPLTSSRIQSLLQDSNGNILIGTERGLSMYNYTTDRFVQIYSNSDQNRRMAGPIINKIDQTSSFIICNTESQGVLLFNKSNYEFVGRFLPEGVDLSSFTVNNMDMLTDRYFLLASNQGLFRFDTQLRKFTAILSDQIGPCSDVAHGKEGFVYVLTNWQVEILSINFEQGMPNFTRKKSVLGGRGYTQLSMDDAGHLWLTKSNNVISMISKPDQLLKNQFDLRDYVFSDEFTRISSLIIDDSGGGWIGSFNQGLFKFRTKERVFRFSSLKTKDEDAANTSSQVINLITIDDHRILATLNVNTCKTFDVNSGEVNEIGPADLGERYFTRAFQSKNGTIYLGSRDPGIYFQNERTDSWQLLSSESMPELEHARARAFAEDRQGRLWIAGFRALYRITLNEDGEVTEGETFSDFGSSAIEGNLLVNVIYADPLEDLIWLGTVNDGLIRLSSINESLYNLRWKSFVPEQNNPQSFPSYYVTSIKRLKNGQLWIGSVEGGISQLIAQEDQFHFRTYREIDGLDDNDVMTFQPDNNGALWIATNRGLNSFNLKTRTFSNYTIEDGLYPASFEVYSSKLADGTLVFGGNKGISYFDPVQVPTKNEIPKLLFGDFRIHNQQVHVGDTVGSRVILNRLLNKTEEIILDHDQGSFSIELISLHYSNTESHNVRYRLLPSDENWLVTPSHNKIANFSLLPPGKYTFEAAVTNSKNEWSETRTLYIIINPPLWRTGWAYLVYIVFSGVVIYIILSTLLRMNSLSHRLKLEQIEKDKVVEIDSARLKLFMNISHEFRTPLTLILGPIAVLKNLFQNNQDAFQHIDLVQRQSKKMLQLVDQVHDLRKGEQNLLKLNRQGFDFTGFVSEVMQDFEALAQESGKQLLLEGDARQLFVLADQSKLEVVINNLLNNAFKFTKKGDTITLAYGTYEDGLFFEVQDTGRGIKEEDLVHLFERFYQSSKEEAFSVGSGIGLELSKMLVELHYGEIEVISEFGHGTKFLVKLPVQYSQEDIFSPQRLEAALATESHEEKQRVKSGEMDFSDIIESGTHAEIDLYYVEDNQELRAFVQEVLSKYFHVTSFENGRECLEAMESEWPDLIISDILMPEMNGLELCKNVKADIRTSHIPVILLTSRSTTDDTIEGLAMGADAYITKPFEMRHLIASVKSILDTRQKLRERFQMDDVLSLDKKKFNQNDKVFIERIYKLLEEHLDNENIDLEQFAQELYMSRSQLFRKVKAITNHTPQELIRTYRLKKAAEFLKTQRFTVQEVCYKTGFKNRAYFTKVFKEQYGQSPNEYRGA
ncbi:response regulator [Reichenbachiella sp.]|uniref:response regulator n=1 Tax=Reichenbachiella sp. TaxID=2184521 RepID=UPI003BB04E33